jgi:hypothetical protein
MFKDLDSVYQKLVALLPGDLQLSLYSLRVILFCIFNSDAYVWPDPTGEVRGQAIEPLYRSVPTAARNDPELYVLLSLIDAIRVGRVREQRLAVKELEQTMAAQ